MFTLLDILKLQTDSLGSALYWLIPSLRLTALDNWQFRLPSVLTYPMAPFSHIGLAISRPGLDWV